MGNLLPAAFSFKGRIGRKQYWARTLLFLLSNLLGSAILIVLAILNYKPPNDTITGRTIVGFVLLGILAIVLVVATVTGVTSAGVRRLHDRGKSGWWIVLYYLVPDRLLFKTSLCDGAAVVIPLVAGAVLIWGLIDLGTLPGRPAENPAI